MFCAHERVLVGSSSSAKGLTYSQFVTAVDKGEVKKVTFNRSNGDISGDFNGTVDGAKSFTSNGPANDLQDTIVTDLQAQGVDLVYTSSSTNIFLTLLPDLILICC